MLVNNRNVALSDSPDFLHPLCISTHSLWRADSIPGIGFLKAYGLLNEKKP